jgi:hypothetical protein
MIHIMYRCHFGALFFKDSENITPEDYGRSRPSMGIKILYNCKNGYIPVKIIKLSLSFSQGFFLLFFHEIMNTQLKLKTCSSGRRSYVYAVAAT